MLNITDIHTLGEDYTVSDDRGNVINIIQVIPVSEIHDAGIGPYDEDKFDSFDEYIQLSLAAFTGFDDVEPNKIWWFSTFDEEVNVRELIEYAVENGYNKVILEHLTEID